MSESVSPQDLIRWAEALAGIAQTGLAFTDVPFERERYEEVINVAADIKHRAAGERPTQPAQFSGEWMASVRTGLAGYATPKVAVGAIVGNDDGELLMIQRADSGIWLYVTGWADVGYSPSEVAEKEVLEETGIECRAVRPLGIFDGLRLGFTTIPLYSIVFQCRAVGGTLRPHPHEVSDLGWFNRGNLPSPIASEDRWVDLAFRAVRDEPIDVYFDPPRPEVWRR
ncbi:MAG: NUDIX domain-containing protein [Acidimicrobiales bacterium]|nr:NUDIX domain-containing protein [Acidimicrobiales bacterium]